MSDMRTSLVCLVVWLLVPCASAVVVFITSGTSWTTPLDWPGVAATVECIGGGGAGQSGDYTPAEGTGGGGGAYALRRNVVIAAGLVPLQVGQGGTSSPDPSIAPNCFYAAPGTASWFLNSTMLHCDFGTGGCGRTPCTGLSVPYTMSCGTGGQAINSVGDIVFSGGAPGAYQGSNYGGGGGGGAGGPNGTLFPCVALNCTVQGVGGVL